MNRSPRPGPPALLLALSACGAAVLGACGQPKVLGRGDNQGNEPASPGPAASPGPGFSLPDGGGGGDVPGSPGSPTVEPIEDCETAAGAAGNFGCTFYSVPFVFKHVFQDPASCHAMFVVNPGRQPVKLRLDKGGAAIPLGPLARLPRGGGLALQLLPYDEAAGLAGGDVAILFLRGAGIAGTWQGVAWQDVACPRGVTPAERGVFEEEVAATFTGKAFRLIADRPVAAYQIWPYGGAGSHYTSATLLLPAESWGLEHYVAAPDDATGTTFAAVVAREDGTEVSLRPTVDILPLMGMPATKKGGRLRVPLNAGELLWVGTPLVGPDVLQDFDRARKGLAASLVVSSKPVAVIGGAYCTYSPAVPPLLQQLSACDSVQQQVPPISALGHEYAAVRHRSRFPDEQEAGAWQLMGAADGTALSYSPGQPAGAPTSLSAGQVVQFATRAPFVVRSQDGEHPFYLGAFMTGASAAGSARPAPDAQGDPDFVNVLPLAQYQSSYVFFTDPTYPETSLVVVRQKGADGAFADVKLDCAAAPISGWRPVADLEYAWVDLVTGAFRPAIPGCSTGRREMTSSAPFAVTVWGWGRASVSAPSPKLGGLWPTNHTSYAFPAGGAIRRINNVRPPID